MIVGVEGGCMFLGNDQPTAEYFGPIQQTQTWEDYQSWMSAQNVAAAGSVVLLGVFINPLAAVGAAAVWLWNTGGSQRHMNKPTTQGG